ncbi:MAG: transposase, partial [Candidatus Competibacterales bacterium]
KTLYGVDQAPCDTQMREVLDPIDPEVIQPAFKVLQEYCLTTALNDDHAHLGYHWVLYDGTQHFGSTRIRCAECCAKKKRNGEIHYYHQLLGGVWAKPGSPYVIPFSPEPILRQDGSKKNDCEREAAKRFFKRLREDFPRRRFVAVGDALFATEPHLKLLKSLNIRFVNIVKPGDHDFLYEQVNRAFRNGQTREFEWLNDDNVECGVRYVNGVPLNKNSRLRVNFFEYWECDPDTEKPLYYCAWITDFFIEPANVYALVEGGRCRWSVENETFNTLKNQGYHLEHNYGHGQKHLSTVLGLLMMLAFMVDQIQAWGCDFFQRAGRRFKTRKALWFEMQAVFYRCLVPSWESLWFAIAHPSLTVLPLPDVDIHDTS